MITLPVEAGEIALAAATEDTRYTMQVVRVTEYEDGFRLDSTDGRMVAVLRGPAGKAPGVAVGQVQRALDSLATPEALTDEEVYCVPLAAWRGSFGKAAKQGVALGAIAGQFVSSHGEGLRQSPLGDVRFPPVDEVIGSAGSPVTRIAFDPRLMARLCKIAVAVGPLMGDRGDPPRVEILVYKGGMVGLVCGGNGYTLDMLAMGLSVPRPVSPTHDIPPEAVGESEADAADLAAETGDPAVLDCDNPAGPPPALAETPGPQAQEERDADASGLRMVDDLPPTPPEAREALSLPRPARRGRRGTTRANR